MVTLIICLILNLVITNFLAKKHPVIASLFFMFFISATIYVPMYIPIGGSTNLTSEYELVPISKETENISKDSYLLLSSDDVYICQYKSDNKLYEIKTLSKKDNGIEVIEQENCDSPKLIVNEKVPKFNWIFNYAKTKISYSFVIPKGTFVNNKL